LSKLQRRRRRRRRSRRREGGGGNEEKEGVKKIKWGKRKIKLRKGKKNKLLSCYVVSIPFCSENRHYTKD
jgi:hypothetical protein